MVGLDDLRGLFQPMILKEHAVVRCLGHIDALGSQWC